MTMRVMSWNLWWRFGAWEERRHAIIDTIRATNPDVLCLQEVWAETATGAGAGARIPGSSMATILADEFGFHAVSSTPIGRHDVGFTNAVLSRWPSSLIADEALPDANGSPGFRRVIAATVATPWGAWPIASTHLDHRFDASLTRQRQCRRLLELASTWRGDPATDLPVIIGADLNAVADTAEVRLLTGRDAGVPGIVFSDAWEQAGNGDGATWRRDNPHAADSAWPNRRIDYVLVSWPRPKPVGNPVSATLAGTAAVDVGATAVWPSDHAAVVVDITTPD
jgi:endonuclease/exonuclease/phosphatase family metal-dependent hydrolase